MRMWALTAVGTWDSQVLAETALCDSCFTSENRAKAAGRCGRSNAPYEFTICSRAQEYACVNCGRRRSAHPQVEGDEVGMEHARQERHSASGAGSAVGYW